MHLADGYVGNFQFEGLFFLIFILIRVELIYNAVLVSDIQQSDSVIHTHISILFHILFPCRSEY